MVFLKAERKERIFRKTPWRSTVTLRASIEHQPNVVYKIPCADCDWCYVGKTGRWFETHKKEHIKIIKTCANGSNIAKHFRGHSTSFRIRKTLEALRTSATKHADNISKPIPNHYGILFKQQSPNLHVYILLLFFLFRLFLHIFCHFAFHFYPSKAVDW